MATPRPTRVTMLRAYVETSVKRARSSVPATPPTTAAAPTPTGKRAATRVPKTINSRISETGMEVVSARVRSAAR